MAACTILMPVKPDAALGQTCTGPAEITLQLESTSACVNGEAFFTVEASNYDAINWEFNDGSGWLDLGGGVETILDIWPVRLEDAGEYRAVARCFAGLATPAYSDAATLTVTADWPTIDADPNDATACVGSTATFAVVATGDALTYEWQISTDGGQNFDPVTTGTGGDTNTYTTAPLALTDNDNQYQCVVTGPCGSAISFAALLTVPTVCTGACCATDGSCTVTTVADCTGTWTESGVCDPNPCPPPTGSCCAANGSCTETTEADCTDTWTEGGVCDPNPCQVTLTGSCCAADCGCTVTTQAGCTGTWTLGGLCNPNPCAMTITTQPQSQTVCVGSSTTLSVVVGGAGPFTYQWKKGGTEVNGITGNSYTIASVISGDSGDYTVEVTGPCGEIESSTATLTIGAVPSITTHPRTQTKALGDSITFSVVAGGIGPFTYQWKKDGTDVSGATSDSYTITAVSATDAGSYTVKVSGGCGEVTSNAATLTADPAAAQGIGSSSCGMCGLSAGTMMPLTLGAIALLRRRWRRRR